MHELEAYLRSVALEILIDTYREDYDALDAEFDFETFNRIAKQMMEQKIDISEDLREKINETETLLLSFIPMPQTR